MRVTADEQRPGDAVGGAVLDDGLGDGQNVSLVERAVERRAAVTRGAERHLLGGVVGIGLNRVIRGHQMGQIDKVFGLGRLTGSRLGHVYSFCPCSTRTSRYAAKRSTGISKGFDQWQTTIIGSWPRFSPAEHSARWPERRWAPSRPPTRRAGR